MNIKELKSGVNEALSSQVSEFCSQLIEIDGNLNLVADSLNEYLSEGKRFRPLFALIGYLGTDSKITNEIYKAAASLEFLQACALIHDDLMDGSDTRRGKPSIHKQFEAKYDQKFGAASAVLIGDLALAWNEQALHRSGISTKSQLAVNPIHDIMRTELMAGQFLDILEGTESTFSVERALKIARYKSGKYSIERPLHFGAAIALPANLDDFTDIYSDYGLPLGEAFQLRDDLLGVFGDPTETGKPAGDDLREGKRTALIAYAFDRGNEATKKLLSEKLGTNLSDSDISNMRGAIDESGAVAHIEDLIEKLVEAALDAIERDELSREGKRFLSEMASLVTKRSR